MAEIVKHFVYHTKHFDSKIPRGFFSDSLFFPHMFPYKWKVDYFSVLNLLGKSQTYEDF